MSRHLVLLFAAVLCACDGLADAEQLRVIDAELLEVLPQTRLLKLTLGRSAAVAVDYWSEDGDRLRVAAAASRTPELELTRLRAGRTYRYRVRHTNHEGRFEVAPLPGSLAALRFEADGMATAPLVMMHLYDPEGFRGFVILDGAGEVVWHLPTLDLPFGATRRQNGNFVLLDKARGLIELTPGGRVVAELPQDLVARELHHDVVATPWNTILFIAFDTRTHDHRPLKGEAVWEWSPETAAVVKRWSSWDHLQPDRDRGPRFGTEWLHLNALAVGPRGNILISAHYLNQVLSIAPGWQSLEWRMGGINATITVAPEEQFSGQHTASEVRTGRVLLFDNNIEGSGGSRVREFLVEGSTARVAWQWQPARPNQANAVGSARRLPSGNTLVHFGMSQGLAGSSGPVEIYEVTPAGAVAWHLVAQGARLSYRAEPLAAIGRELGVR